MEKKNPKKGLAGVLQAVSGREWMQMLAVFLAGLAAMYLLLVAVCLLPNDWLSENVRQGQEVYQQEFIGQWTPIFAYGQSDKLDIGTDNLIMTTLLTDPEQSVFQQAVEGKAETRYWQGYKVWLRPAFCLFTYVDLRTLMMFVLAVLMTVNLLGVQRRFGYATAVGFGVALAMGHVLVVPWLFQYFEVFWIALAAMAWLLHRYQPGQMRPARLALLFLVVGMATQYFDFLTAPVLTLCLPLAVVLLADMRCAALRGEQRWANLLWPCIGWSWGWLGGWASKWPLSTLLLQRDVLADALSQVAYRSAVGQAEARPSMVRSLARNLFCFLPMNQLHAHGNDPLLAVVLLTLAAVVAVALVRLWRQRPTRAQGAAGLPALACASIPYLWFIVLAGHTEEHYVFAYRSQIATAFLLIGVWACWRRMGRDRAGEKTPPPKKAPSSEGTKGFL